MRSTVAEETGASGCVDRDVEVYDVLVDDVEDVRVVLEVMMCACGARSEIREVDVDHNVIHDRHVAMKVIAARMVVRGAISYFWFFGSRWVRTQARR
eukprot:6059501-Amphidinium_carterae.1